MQQQTQQQGRLIKQSLQAFGLDPEQWILGPHFSKGQKWVVIRNRNDKDFRFAARLHSQSLIDLYLLSL